MLGSLGFWGLQTLGTFRNCNGIELCFWRTISRPYKSPSPLPGFLDKPGCSGSWLIMQPLEETRSSTPLAVTT